MQNSSNASTRRETAASSPPAAGNGSLKSKLFLVFVIVFIAANLRTASIAVGPVIESIQANLSLSGSAVGLLLTLPILCYGAFAPLAPKMLRYTSAEHLILVGCIIFAFGLVLRSLFGTFGLYTGTLIAGAGTSVVMVVLPAIIKKNFPDKAGMMMGFYSTALCLGATIAAAFTVPLENVPGSDWRWALGFWTLPLIVSIFMWVPYTKGQKPNTSRARSASPRLRKCWLAWQVSLFMGIQSSIAYCVFGWLPVMLIERGMTALAAGFILSITLGVQLITSLTAPWIATRGKDQRATIAVMLSMAVFGLMTTIYGSMSLMWLWATVLGLGLGGMFSIALSLLVLRAPTPQLAASLSGMAQGVGYIVAAIGPVIVGLLHELTGGWDAVAVFYLILVSGSCFFGMGAGRAKYVSSPDSDS
jgi:CP family cyanate transporter-like MFS transporter